MTEDEELNLKMPASSAKKRLIGALNRQFGGNESSTNNFVEGRISKLINFLDSEKVQSSVNVDETLMERMINLGLFPSFSFPLEVAVFEAKGSKKIRGGRWSKPYIYARTSQDLKVALSEFQPGRRLTINKQTFLVEGVGVSFPKHPVNHLSEMNLDQSRVDPDNPGKINPNSKEWNFFHHCSADGCNYIIGDMSPEWNISGDKKCPSCGIGSNLENAPSTLRSMRMITPEVFRPKMVPFNSGGRFNLKKSLEQNKPWQEMRALEDPEDPGNRVQLGRARLPTPLKKEIEDEGFIELTIPDGQGWQKVQSFQFNSEKDQDSGTELLVVNPGPNGNGYKVCHLCGLVGMNEEDLEGGHHRPYSIMNTDIGPYVNEKYNEFLELKESQIVTAPNKERESLEEDLNKHRDPENKKKWIQEKAKKLKEESERVCNGTFTNVNEGTEICLGMTFRTDIFLLRIPIEEPITTRWKHKSFEAGFRAIKEALITEVTDELELINREIGGNLRKVVVPRSDDSGIVDQFLDIYLFDNASGGAGLVREISGERIPDILNSAKNRLSGQKCVNQEPCGRVCIGCLLDFRNQMEADRMDRSLGFQILEHLKSGVGLDFRLLSSNGIESNLVRKELDNLSGIFPDLQFEQTGEVEFTVKGKMGRRRVHLHSILQGASALPPDAIPHYEAPTYFSTLESRLISVPYELVRDAPNQLIEDLYPRESEDSNEAGFSVFEGF